jgi:hypothetical protein
VTAHCSTSRSHEPDALTLSSFGSSSASSTASSNGMMGRVVRLCHSTLAIVVTHLQVLLRLPTVSIAAIELGQHLKTSG